MTALTGQRALITGASSGIGKATALALAEAKASAVALVSRSPEKLASVAEAAEQKGVTARCYALDLSNVAQVRKEVGRIAADFGTIDILVNNAGMGYTGNLMDTSLADWQRIIDLNLTSVFQCIQAILPGMRDRGKGSIINVASIAAKQSFPGWGAYSVSKAALVSLSKGLSVEEQGSGIRITVISPGAVNTPLWDTDTVEADFDRSSMLTPEAVAQSILHAVQLPSNAVIDELTLMPSAGAL